MTLPTLRSEQHAQILGYSIIGYGVSFLLDLVGPLTKLLSYASMIGSVEPEMQKSIEPFKNAFDDSLWMSVLYAVAAFVVSFIAGVVIKNRNASPRPAGLTFAILAFGFFPLGTLVSVYALVYLFAIDDAHDAGVQLGL